MLEGRQRIALCDRSGQIEDPALALIQNDLLYIPRLDPGLFSYVEEELLQLLMQGPKLLTGPP